MFSVLSLVFHEKFLNCKYNRERVQEINNNFCFMEFFKVTLKRGKIGKKIFKKIFLTLLKCHYTDVSVLMHVCVIGRAYIHRYT